ncbi:MAG: UTP--glucose-phosphate uridylyltransferase [Patescibacteria group bacterium]|nr:UTP--glucose-phosphate uridylyltransferase [Patescibacteria group bacterium]
MNITKAIIPVAGWGTRRLPITKAIEKCMLPIGNRPVVDYVVQDCIKAGITDIYFIISEQSTQLRDYYRSNIDLIDYLRRNGKEAMIPLIAPPNIKMHYITQSSFGKYGTSIPVSLVVPLLNEGESAVVLMGDDGIYRKDGKSEVARLIEAAGEDSSMLGVKVPHEDTSKYGVIEANNNGEFVKIVEKPNPDDAPSDMINVSKYVFSYKALKMIEEHAKLNNISGEYYITDPINEYVSNGGKLKVIEAEGQYIDSGTTKGWLKANQIVINDME